MERKEEAKNLVNGGVGKNTGRDAWPCVCTSIRNIGVVGSRSLPMGLRK